MVEKHAPTATLLGSVTMILCSITIGVRPLMLAALAARTKTQRLPQLVWTNWQATRADREVLVWQNVPGCNGTHSKGLCRQGKQIVNHAPAGTERNYLRAATALSSHCPTSHNTQSCKFIRTPVFQHSPNLDQDQILHLLLKAATVSEPRPGLPKS